MPIDHPTYCQPAAFDLLRSQLDRLETDDGLLTGACSIALHALPDHDPQDVADAIDALADQVRDRVQSADPRAAIAHAHAVLFEELGFTGDTENYYDPVNSYIPCVIERKRGLPITLCLVYKLVLARLGVAVHGVNAPGHFLARVVTTGAAAPMLVDPFLGGRALTVVEALERIRQTVGPKASIDEDMLPLATHRVWLSRMLRNLINLFGAREQTADHGAMLELQGLLDG